MCSRMSRKRKVAGFAEKMCTYMMLMGYHGDFQATVAKDLNRRIWKRKRKLSRKRCRRLLYLLYAADSSTLLSFTVSLGRLIWRNNLRAKQRKFEKKLLEKIKHRSRMKTLRRDRPGRVKERRRLSTVKKQKEAKGHAMLPKIFTGFQLRPISGSRLRMVVRCRVIRNHGKAEVGSPVYRLAMAMNFLSFRNVYITTEWEFWAICFIQKVCGFWRSIAFGEGLSDSLISVAKEFGLNVVSYELLERLESSFGCSSTTHY